MASRIFSLRLIKTNYSLMPIIAFTGFGVTLCSGYITYMIKRKPDVNFRISDAGKMPEWDVAPDDYRKLLLVKKVDMSKMYDREVENLKKEITAAYSR